MSVDSLIIEPWCKTMTEIYNKIKHCRDNVSGGGDGEDVGRV